MKNRLLLLAGLSTAFALSVAPLGAAEKKAAKPAPTEKAPDPGKVPEGTKPAADASRPLPFRGKVSAVDAKSFTLKGKEKERVFAVTDKTTFIGKDGAAAKLSDVTAGEDVRGSATKNGDAWTAVKVTIGAKPAATKPADEKKAEASEPKVPAKPGSDGTSPQPAKKKTQ